MIYLKYPVKFLFWNNFTGLCAFSRVMEKFAGNFFLSSFFTYANKYPWQIIYGFFENLISVTLKNLFALV